MIPSGVPGLDDILRGGFTPNRLYLIEGSPGAGKTTMSLQFLIEGARRGEKVLYITLSESENELRSVAASHDWGLEGINIHEVIPDEDFLNPDDQYTMFHPSEVELGETTKNMLAAIDTIKPDRVVIDSLSELRLLAGSPLKYRRQVLAYKKYFSKRNITVLMVDDNTQGVDDLEVKSIAHGVIMLEQLERDYGSDRRRLRIQKYRGVGFRSGFHDYNIFQGGIFVYGRLVAADSRKAHSMEQRSSGIKELDELLGGGIEAGTSTLINGPSGTGKSTVAAQFLASNMDEGRNTALFLFEEGRETLLSRTDNVNINLRSRLGTGELYMQEIDPAELSPGELSHSVQKVVEENNTQVVVIDSLNGYLNSSPDERFLVTHLHEMLSYLSQRGVVTVLVGVQAGLMGAMKSFLDVSYLADNVILLRHFEHAGQVKQAISVFKKRGGKHQKMIRELQISSEGIHVGEPLLQFRGVLTGVPQYYGEEEDAHATAQSRV